MRCYLRSCLRVLVLLMLVLSGGRLLATHITGAEITYQCINPISRTYQVTLTVYRDCINGQAPFDNSVQFFIFRGSNNSLYTTATVNLNSTAVEIIPVDWTACTGQPYNICVEYARYITNINLPNLVGGYNIGWARCCRNNVVTNILTNQGITVLASVPGTNITGCNSTPKFNNLPPVFLCVGQAFSFDHSATDQDGDSLVYSIANPYTGVNFAGLGATQTNPVVSNTGPFPNPMGPPSYQFLQYLPGYSWFDPFGSGNFNIDPLSGLLTLTPTQTGLSVFAISVKEYRNGVLLSENKRDFQINVVTCSPQGAPPAIGNNLAPVPGSNGDTVYAKPTETFCYNVTVQDPNPTDVVTLFPVSATFGIGNTLPPPYATLSVTGTNPAIGQVCWSAPCELQGDTLLMIVGGRDTADCPGYNISYDTTYVVIDTFVQPIVNHTVNGVPNVDTVYLNPLQTLCYTVQGSDADLGDTLQTVPISGPFAGLGGTATISTTGINPISSQICWNPGCTLTGQTFTFITAVQDANRCNLRRYDTLIVVVAPRPATGANPGGTICQGQSFQLSAFGGTTYQWSPAGGLSNTGIFNPVATPPASVTYQVLITDVFGCTSTDTVQIQVNPLPPANAGPDAVRCPGVPLQLQASGGISYSWTPAATLSNPAVSNPLASPLVTTTYTVTVTDANNCSATDQVTVTPMYAIAGPGQAICLGDTIGITASGGISYSWAPAGSLSNASIVNPQAFPTTTTTYVATVTDAAGCVDTAQVTVLVRALPPANAGPDTEVCIGSQVPLSASGGVSYSWAPATGLSNVNISNPIAGPAADITYTVTVTDGFGCVNTDQVLVDVNPLPPANAGPDLIKCGNTGIPLQGSGGVGYSWSPSTGLSNPNISNPVANPALTTLYTVTVTDTNGCVASDQALVTTMYAVPGPNQAICFGDTIGITASGGVSYTWSPTTGLSNPNTQSPLAFPAVTTTYIVTAFSSSGCSDTAQVTVVVRPLPPANAGPDTEVCIGSQVPLNASGGVSYSWAPATGLSNVNISNPLAGPLADITYTVTVTDVFGCVNTDQVLVDVNPLPVVDAGPDTVKCGNIGVNFQATGGIGFAWTPVQGLDNALISNPLANPDASTTYYVAVTDTNGCVASDSVFIRAMYANAGPDLPVCIGDSVQVLASGGVAYVWDADPFLISTGTAQAVVFPPDTALFAVTVTDISGCSDRDTVRIIVNPLPVTSTFGTDPYVCSGGGTVVNATGGVQYLWSPAAVFNDPTLASPIASPTYSGASLDSVVMFYVTVTDTNGCVQYDSLAQTVRLLPIITASPDTIKCIGDTIQLTATGGVSYSWSPAAGLSATNVQSPFAFADTTVTYTATVTAVWGCSDSLPVTVTVIKADAGPDVTICFGDTIMLQASGGVAYSWAPSPFLSDPFTATPLVNPPVSMDFVVEVTDVKGCTDIDTVRVSVNVLPPANAGPDQAICIGDTTTLQASGGVLYAWSPGLGLGDIDSSFTQAFPLTTTAYVITVTDTNQCVNRDTMVLTVNPLPLADAGPDVTRCGETPLQLQASGGVIYSWTPATGLSDPLIANPLAGADSTTLYTVTVTDTNGCVNVDSVRVRAMYAEAGIGDTICLRDTAQLVASHIGGQAAAYSWAPATFIVNPNQATIAVFPPVTTTYTVTVTDTSGCADTNSVTVTVLPLPPANAGNDTALCIGDTITLRASGGIRYAWNPDPDLSRTDIPNPLAWPITSTAYVVTVTDGNQCQEKDTVTITVNPLPVVTASLDTAICRRDTALLRVTGANTYVWSPANLLTDPFSANPQAFPTADTWLYVEGTDRNQCRNRDSVFVTVWQLPTIEGDTQDSICLGQSTLLTVSGAPAYRWSTGETLPVIEVDPAFTTTYWVIPYSPENCPGDTLFSTVTVVRELPIPGFRPTPEEGFYPLEVSMINESQFATRYTWNFGDGTIGEGPAPVHTYNAPGEYAITLTADNDIGCPAEFTYRFVKALDFTIFYPNAFSPNGDGINDDFYMVMNSIAVFQIRIYDRWGREVFSSQAPDFRWDGRASGVTVPEGVYTYAVRAETYRGEVITRSGSITLIR
ncbi:MAG: gliding motility-associated C-terminal domain-containing protein [Bacteroidia bacterium]|nr:gliding motility-associated C-terminal domain-containing protein [Bacteroidia bacterium]